MEPGSTSVCNDEPKSNEEELGSSIYINIIAL